MRELTLASLALAGLAAVLLVLPFVVKLLQCVPLRRHLRRGAVALLLFEEPANISHSGNKTRKYLFKI